jgi:hypothetical protein
MLVVAVVVLVMTKQTYPHTPLAKAAKRKAYSYSLVQRCSFYGVAACGWSQSCSGKESLKGWAKIPATPRDQSPVSRATDALSCCLPSILLFVEMAADVTVLAAAAASVQTVDGRSHLPISANNAARHPVRSQVS